MLYWFRTHGARIALATLSSLLALGVSTLSPHGDECHDSVCLPMAIEHDASAHRFIAPPTGVDGPDLRCLVCDWLRSFRPRTEARVLFTAAVEAGTVVHFNLFAASVSAPAAQPPLRAPPTSPLV